MSKATQYPRFITDVPNGTDLYEGQSQNSLANNITQFITENEGNSKKVIGIEGEWGSGKSNVIEILKQKLGGEYFFFIFDAWGHQEDLTRRSLLEGLLSTLAEKNEKIRGSKQTWSKELELLLSKKVRKEQTNIPKLSWAVILTIIGVIFMPITKSLSENYLKSHSTQLISPGIWDYILASIILTISFLPLIAFIAIKLGKSKKGELKDTIGELFYIYKGKEVKNTFVETISEDEPSVIQFSSFLEKIEKGIDKKLVIVFDNMDRLPSKKVKEIWSSIHIFFARENEKINSWAIIPFDNDHICKIFNEEDKDKQDRAESYIHKTFSIVFHVPPPILSDWKGVFSTKFIEAFGHSAPPEEHLDTMFEYHHLSNEKIKPRDIIYFINELVALKKMWQDQIPLRYFGVFVLRRDEIRRNPLSATVSRDYLQTLSPFFQFDDTLDTFISALYFNVPIEKADEILLKRPIEKALLGEGNFEMICTHKHFFKILDSVFYSCNPNLCSAVNSLENLPAEFHDRQEMISYWKRLSHSIINSEPLDAKLSESIIIVTRRVKDQTLAEKLIRKYFGFAVSTDSNGRKYFTGFEYYDLVRNFSSMIRDNYPSLNLLELLPENFYNPEEFLQFAVNTPNQYKQYQVTTDNQKLNAFFQDKFDADDILRYCRHLSSVDRSELGGFINHVNLFISNVVLTPDKHSKITDILMLGKVLSKQNKLGFIIPGQIALQLIKIKLDYYCAADLVLSIVSENFRSGNPVYPQDPIFTKFIEDVKLSEEFIDSYKYYLSFTELIQIHHTSPSSLIKFVLSELINKSNYKVEGDMDYLISNYIAIKAEVLDNNPNLCGNIVHKASTLTHKVDANFVTMDNLRHINSLIHDNHDINCTLIDIVIEHANKFIHGLDESEWANELKNCENSPVIELLNTLEQVKQFNLDKLPVSASNAYSEVLISISKNQIPLPENIQFWNHFFSLLKGNFTNLFKNVRDELLNYNHPQVTLTEFAFFEMGLFAYGKLDEEPKVADDFLRRVLIPIAVDEEKYLDILRKNVEQMRRIVEQANDSIIEFKNTLDAKCPEILIDESTSKFAGLLLKKAHILQDESAESVGNTKN